MNPEIAGWLEAILKGRSPLPPGAKQGSEGKATRAKMKREGFPEAARRLSAQGLGPSSIAVRLGKSRAWVVRILEMEEDNG